MYDRGDNKVHHGKKESEEFKFQELTISAGPWRESIALERLNPRWLRVMNDEEEGKKKN
jgi:hypothetical protein